MLQLNLRAQHLAFILNYLQEIVLRDVYGLTRQIDEKLNQYAEQGSDHMIQVSVTEEEVMRIFELLTRSPEGVAAAINRDIDTDLGPQIYMKVMEESALPMPTEEEINEGAQVPPKPFTKLFQRYMTMKANNYKNKIQRIKNGYEMVGLTYTPPTPPAELEQFLN